MESTQFMGMLIAALISLLTMASIIVAIIIKPIINLNKSITKLNDSIDMLNTESKNLENRVTTHGKELDEHSKHLIIHDQEIKHMKEHLR